MQFVMCLPAINSRITSCFFHHRTSNAAKVSGLTQVATEVIAAIRHNLSNKKQTPKKTEIQYFCCSIKDHPVNSRITLKSFFVINAAAKVSGLS